MASEFMSEAEARTASACAPVPALEDLTDSRIRTEAQEAVDSLEARLQQIASRVRRGYLLSEEEKEVLRKASEREE